MFGPPKRGRQKGGKQVWTYKAPAEIEAWLDAKTEIDPATGKRKYALSNFVSDYLEFYKHFEEEMGGEIFELLRRANDAKLSRGKLAAQLVKAQLKRK